MTWTESQKTAMQHVHGDILVMAGAGSGKTEVLVRRCVNLVTQDRDPCGVDNLLIVTFTDAAANQMRGRIAALLRTTAQDLARSHPQNAHRLLEQAALVDQAQISTLHSFCAKTLRLWFHQCNLDPAFTVLDEHEAHLLLSQALQTVLDSWLTRTDAQAESFAHFFDVYSQSKVSELKRVMDRLEQIWELTPDPRQWLDKARQLAGAGEAQLFDAARADILDMVNSLAPVIGQKPFDADPHGKMFHALCDLHQQLAGAAAQLGAHQTSAWDAAAQSLSTFDWPQQIRINKSAHDAAQAENFKASVYEKTKAQLQTVTSAFFAAPRTTLLQCNQQLAALSLALLNFYAEVHQEFESLKNAARQLSFADLERRLLEALQMPNSPVAADLQRRFCHVLVDEYQDINPVQQEILTRICRPNSPGSFFIVGDALQSIYGFRGGEPRLFLDRANALRHSPGPSQRLVEMTENFRTLPNLLDAMNLIFQKLFARLPADAGATGLPPLRHGRPAPATCEPHVLTGSPIELLIVASQARSAAPEEVDHDDSAQTPADSNDPADGSDAAIDDMSKAHKEAVILVDRIREIMGQNKISPSPKDKARPIAYRDIAILLRSPRNQAQEFVRVFLENGIPAQSALTTGYFAAPEVQEIIALLEVLDNPFQDIALATTLLGPLGRFSYDDLAAIRVEFPPARSRPFHQAVFSAMDHPVTGAAPADSADLPQRLQTFFHKLDGWRAAIRTLGVPEGLAHIYQESGLLIWSAGLPHGRQRVANLHMLYQRAMQFSHFQRQGLGRFLSFLRDLQDQDIDLGSAPVATAGDDALRIMSIHKSKGLEFPIVILAGLSSKFNDRDVQGDCLIDRENGLGLQYKNPDTGQRRPSPQYQQIRRAADQRRLAEEARLLYVAMTRARDQLILVGSVDNKNNNSWQAATHPSSVKCPLDWIAPIFAAADKTSLSDGSRAMMIVRRAATAAPSSQSSGSAPASQSTAAMLDQIRNPISTETPPPADPDVQALITRLTRTYPWQPLTMLPAVTKVTELKSHIPAGWEESPAAELILTADHPTSQLPETTQSPGIQRGIATHRLLQLLDFTQPLDAAGIQQQMLTLVERRLFQQQDAALIDAAAVAWIFQTPIGQQIVAIASAQGAADGASHIHRELPFLWAMEPHLLAAAPQECASLATNPADRVLVRGVIDLLLATPTALHIIDYKTDIASQIPGRMAMYNRQLRYYAQAVTAILGRPVTHATLLFILAQSVTAVDLTA